MWEWECVVKHLIYKPAKLTDERPPWNRHSIRKSCTCQNNWQHHITQHDITADMTWYNMTEHDRNISLLVFMLAGWTNFDYKTISMWQEIVTPKPMMLPDTADWTSPTARRGHSRPRRNVESPSRTSCDIDSQKVSFSKVGTVHRWWGTSCTPKRRPKFNKARSIE